MFGLYILCFKVCVVSISKNHIPLMSKGFLRCCSILPMTAVIIEAGLCKLTFVWNDIEKQLSNKTLPTKYAGAYFFQFCIHKRNIRKEFILFELQCWNWESFDLILRNAKFVLIIYIVLTSNLKRIQIFIDSTTLF